MNPLFLRALGLALWMAVAIGAQAQTTSPSPTTRGQLLYSTHCGACHSEQMHWRTLNQARDWDSLKAQVRRWQNAVALAWSEDDITEVARHLNDTIYRFPRPERAQLRSGTQQQPIHRLGALVLHPMARALDDVPLAMRMP